jgi:hypothetical protein
MHGIWLVAELYFLSCGKFEDSVYIWVLILLWFIGIFTKHIYS